MKKSDLTNAAARQRGRGKADAADQLDRAIHRIIKALRLGRPAHLPGLGTLEPGKRWTFRPDPSSQPSPAKARPAASKKTAAAPKPPARRK